MRPIRMTLALGVLTILTTALTTGGASAARGDPALIQGKPSIGARGL